jgi:hypothetical protein
MFFIEDISSLIIEFSETNLATRVFRSIISATEDNCSVRAEEVIASERYKLLRRSFLALFDSCGTSRESRSIESKSAGKEVPVRIPVDKIGDPGKVFSGNKLVLRSESFSDSVVRIGFTEATLLLAADLLVLGPILKLART